MYLVDTNIFLEIILQQERKEEAKEFLKRVSSKALSITEFTVDSMGLILFYRNLHHEFLKFVVDVFVQRNIQLLRPVPTEMEHIVNSALRFNLDFDKTPRGRLTPQQILKTITPKTS